MPLVGTGQITIADMHDGVSYQLVNSNPAIQKSIGGAYTPSSVTYSALMTVGAGSPGGYSGRFKIATSLNGTDFTDQYTSSSDESSTTYAVPASIKTIRVRLYLAGGTTTLLDETLSTVVLDGATGAQGPSLTVIPTRSTIFTATDGTLDASQSNITFDATVSNVSNPTYVWSFSGFDTAPTNSGTSALTVTQAQFGAAKAATVMCTVNGTYAYKHTITRLEKSTAAAGATVGATLSNIVGLSDYGNLQPDVYYEHASWVIDSADWEVVPPSVLTAPKCLRWKTSSKTAGVGATWLGQVITPAELRAPVKPGETLYISHLIATEGTATGTLGVNIAWYNSAGTNISTSFAASVTFPQTAALEVKHTVVVPAGAVSVGVYVRRGALFGGGTGLGWIEIGQIRVSRTEDGATVGAPTGTYVGGTLAQTVESNASTALSTANTAATDANTANTLLSDIASDAKLTPSEKHDVRREWDVVINEKAGINTNAGLYAAAASANTTYNTALQTLGTYLNAGAAYTLSTSTPPSWINDASLDTTTTIAGATFRSNWQALYAARQVLLNKIAEEAGKVAAWAGVTGAGKPADNATVGATFGLNINGQITATNAGTYIEAAAINDALIANLAAGKITTGTLGASTAITVGSSTAGIIIDAPSNSIRVKNASSERIRIGNLGSTYGISGKLGGTDCFRLDENGLYLRPQKESIRTFSKALGLETVIEGVLNMTYDAASGSGTVTVDIPIPDIAAATNNNALINYEVIGEFRRLTNSSGNDVYVHTMYKNARVVAEWSWTNLSFSALIDLGTSASHSDDTTNFPITKASIILDNNTSPYFFLRLVSRTSMVFNGHATNTDETQYRYVVRALVHDSANWSFN